SHPHGGRIQARRISRNRTSETENDDRLPSMICPRQWRRGADRKSSHMAHHLLECSSNHIHLAPRLEFELRALLLPHAVEDPKHVAFNVPGEELLDGGFVNDGDLGAST